LFKSFIVALSVRYSVADKCYSVCKCRIILSSNARIQWHMSHMYTWGHDDEVNVVSSTDTKLSGHVTQKCWRLFNKSF
jgi:hypothetical protein